MLAGEEVVEQPAEVSVRVVGPAPLPGSSLAAGPSPPLDAPPLDAPPLDAPPLVLPFLSWPGGEQFGLPQSVPPEVEPPEEVRSDVPPPDPWQ